MFLNLDAGERDDESESLWTGFDLLNCACGGHAGDSASMHRVVAFCARSGVRLGAHPSYRDREAFGRRSPFEAVPDESALIDVRHAIAAQCRALATVADHHGVAVRAIKPHGALYHDAATYPALAAAVLESAVEVLGAAVLVIGPPAGAMRAGAERLRLQYAREGFADRRMRSDGSLVPRDEPGALILEPHEAARQATALADTVDTVCIHADTPGAIDIARAVREAIGG